MSLSWVAIGAWLGHSAAGGGLLLLLAWLLMRRTDQPARQQRLGEYAVAAALLLAVLSLAPAWLVLRVPVAEVPPAPAQEQAAVTLPANAPVGLPSAPEEIAADEGGGSPAGELASGELPPEGADLAEAVGPVEEPPPGTALPPAPPPVSRAVPHRADPAPTLPAALQAVLAALGIVYAGAAALLAARWLLGYVALWRLLRAAGPAPPRVARLAAGITPGRRPPRLLLSRRLRVPVSCGLWRPTVVLPASLVADPAALRWVLAHEYTHLERRDAWSCLLLSAGQVVYFYLPWFWWLRRRVGLCQEFVADAAVAALGADAADYAQFLLGLVKAPPVPAGATGVAGRPSDLFQRIAMLLRAPRPVERRCPRLWSCATLGGLAVPAVLVAGIGLQAVAAARPAAVLPTPPPADTARLADESPRSRPEPPAPRRPTTVEPRAQRAEREQATPRSAPTPPAWPPDRRLGVRVAPPGAALRDQLGLPPAEGLVIELVLPGSAAERGGLKAHDILLALDGKPVPADVPRFVALLARLRDARPLATVVLRQGRQQTLAGPVLAPQPGPPRPFPGGPAFPPPQMAGMPPEAPVVTAVSRTGDEFTTRYQDGTLVLTVAGTVTEGGVRVREITVARGGAMERYPALEQVPPAYRAGVRHLLDVSSQGSTRVRIHSS